MSRGLAWEVILERWHDAYRRDRRAVVLRCHPGVKMLAPPDKGGVFRAAFSGEGPPDFVGVVAGRGLVFDAKSTQAAKWPLAKLKDHQARDLSAWVANGGLAGLAVLIREQAVWFDWAVVGAAWWAWRRGEGGAASWGAEMGKTFGDGGWIDVVG